MFNSVNIYEYGICKIHIINGIFNFTVLGWDYLRTEIGFKFEDRHNVSYIIEVIHQKYRN